ncbi:hypothetical protein FJ492_00490 [Mesorhizobium sp. B2-5-4]|uniref:hypothetical protein n=1 Tax=Mesorhizobium sp. B2-5-4 TaxID=2589926 RepID=UPI00112BF5BC|nr:hypothetical protein [Mesorhizobium sp. B2-5-4]TPK49609.1 hypothetical protein FJ492_00490 [Mesorhizobium sp. B2-5-4]
MTTMDMGLLAGALWVGGGLLFLQGIVANRDPSPAVGANSRAVVEDLRRGRPAALVAAVLFIAVWPFIWAGAHVVRR